MNEEKNTPDYLWKREADRKIRRLECIVNQMIVELGSNPGIMLSIDMPNDLESDYKDE